MSVNYTNPQTFFTDLISIGEANNEAVDFEPARINRMNRAVELLARQITASGVRR